MLRNALVVVIMVNFVTAWGEYLLCTALTNDHAARTMPIVLSAAQGGMRQWAWPRIAAVYMIVVTPGHRRIRVRPAAVLQGADGGVLRA